MLNRASAAAAVLHAVGASPASLNSRLLAAVAAGLFLARFVLLQRIEAVRPARATTSAEFGRLQRLSVLC